jgi:lysozyme
VTLLGVDVSEHQGVIDWPRVAASGVSFAIVKVREGTTYADPRGQANIKGARSAGLVVGAYHFLVSTSAATTQADAFVKDAPPDTLHCLDVEAPGPLDVRGWVARYREHYPHHPLLIYTNGPLWHSRSKVTYDAKPFGPLWVAGYRTSAYVPTHGSLAQQWVSVSPTDDGGLPFLGYGGGEWTLMQFTDHAQVPGITGGVDGNAYRGTLDGLKALTGTVEDDMPLSSDDLGKVAEAVWAAHFGAETAADRLLRASRPTFPPVPTAAEIAAVVAASLKSLPAGTATLDDATIGKVVAGVLDGFATRLVR